MRIAWHLGFGWPSIATVVACGIGIQFLPAPFSLVLYIPFLVVALYMSVRFRLFTRQPWRRFHARAMASFGRLAANEYEAARREGRDYDIRNPCRSLARELFGDDGGELLDDAGRKAYYRGLATEFAPLFVEGVADDRRNQVAAGIASDIEASRLGPDVLVARMIETRHSRREAANYLRALMAGEVN